MEKVSSNERRGITKETIEAFFLKFEYKTAPLFDEDGKDEDGKEIFCVKIPLCHLQ